MPANAFGHLVIAGLCRGQEQTPLPQPSCQGQGEIALAAADTTADQDDLTHIKNSYCSSPQRKQGRKQESLASAAGWLFVLSILHQNLFAWHLGQILKTAGENLVSQIVDRPKIGIRRPLPGQLAAQILAKNI